MKFFASAQGFFASSFGSGAIGWVLSHPASCYRLVDGEWQRCGPFDDCKEDIVGRLFESVRCENLLGLDAFANTEPTATILAIVIGSLCGGLATLAANLAKRGG